MINPIEMVPMIINENDHGSLLPIHLINSVLRAKVSTVIFEFSWANLSEIICHQYKQIKIIFSFHPTIPSMGRQINFSINWKFQD